MAWIEWREKENGLRVKYLKDDPKGRYKKGQWRPGTYEGWVYWYGEDGKRHHQKAGTDMGNIKKVLAQVESGQILKAAGIEPDRKDKTTEEVFRIYNTDHALDEHKEQSTIRHIEERMKSFLLGFGDEDDFTKEQKDLRCFHGCAKKKIEDITEALCRDYYRKLILRCEWSKRHNKAGVRMSMIVLKAFFHYAQAIAKVISTDPCAFYKIKKPNKAGRYIYEEEMFEIKPYVTNPRIWDFIWANYNTGPRVNELLGLESKDVTPDRLFYLGKTKNGEDRWVPIPDDCWTTFTGKQGKVFAGLTYSAIRQSWNKAKEKAEAIRMASGRPEFGRMRPHDWRHSWITNALENGMPVQTVMLISGHKNIQSLWHYLHAKRDTLRPAMLAAQKMAQEKKTERKALLEVV